MDLRTLNPKYMEESIFKAQHTLAVASATKLISGNHVFAPEQKKDLENAFEAMLLNYNQVNVQKKASHVPAIGIDLGTTFCCMAVFRNHRSVEIIPSVIDKNKTLSYVTYPAPAGGSHDASTDSDSDREDGMLFGDTAKDLAYENLKGTIYDVKRMLGRPFTDPRLVRDREFWSFDIQNDGGDIVVKTSAGTHSPLEILTELLKHLKIQADAFLNGEVVSAVVTIPAYCNKKQRELTTRACNEAGLNVLQLVNEPTAAAVAYSLHKKDRNQAGTTNCVVFDFGGGTFDVAVLTINQNQVVVQAVGGDDHLGGQNIDNLMVDYCLEQFQEKHGAGADIKINLLTADTKEKIKIQNRIRRLKKDCEMKKCHLSQHQCRAVVISVDAMHAGTDLVVQMTRDTFNSLTKEVFEKCIDILEDVLNESNFSKESIEEVVLVGGSCRIPRVQEMVSVFFGGKHLCRSIDADEAVAHGAALLAYYAEHVEVPNVLVQEQEVQEDDAVNTAHDVCTQYKLVICTDSGTEFLNFALAPVIAEVSVKGNVSTNSIL